MDCKINLKIVAYVEKQTKKPINNRSTYVK